MDELVDRGGVSGATDQAATLATRLLRGNPFRPLDWRWQRADQLLEPGVRRRRRDDPWVIRARGHRAALARGHAGVSGDDPSVYGAYRLWRGLPRPRWELEARLLAGQTDHEIAARMGLEADTIGAYEVLFYSVRDGLGATDWIYVVIGLRPDQALDPGDAERIVKLYAYHHGPGVFDALLGSVFTDGRPPADPRLADLLRLSIAVQTIQVTAENAPDVIRLYLLAVELAQREADQVVDPVTRPIAAPPREVAIGGGMAPAVHPEGASAAREAGEGRRATPRRPRSEWAATANRESAPPAERPGALTRPESRGRAPAGRATMGDGRLVGPDERLSRGAWKWVGRTASAGGITTAPRSDWARSLRPIEALAAWGSWPRPWSSRYGAGGPNSRRPSGPSGPGRSMPTGPWRSWIGPARRRSGAPDPDQLSYG
jgi:hypothetical protein